MQVDNDVMQLILEMLPVMEKLNNRTQINHMMDDGERRILLYKDKYGRVWYQWRPKGTTKFTQSVEIKCPS